ncbi:unnamed protein product [Dimorphilus gyrociliatus]|uniref:Uncharacterized protein n=1 Tax=Dimorphilus gyrociliatus TaxID=2664684 RepID=A0A7I8VK09_9ANNE|nr:unnamed protein product [Dimorphilus gyrociliatus]
MVEFQKYLIEEDVSKNLENIKNSFNEIEKLFLVYQGKYKQIDEENKNIWKEMESVRLEANEYLRTVKSLKRTPMKRSKSVKAASFSIQAPSNRLKKSLVSPPRRRSCSPTVMNTARTLSSKIKGIPISILESVTDVDGAINSVKRSNTKTKTISGNRKNKVNLFKTTMKSKSEVSGSHTEGDDESVDVTFTFSTDTKELKYPENNGQVIEKSIKSNSMKNDINSYKYGFCPHSITPNLKRNWLNRSKIPVKVK